MGEFKLFSLPVLIWSVIAPILIAIFVFMVRVGDEDKFIDWEYLAKIFRHISPFYWTYLGISAAVGLSIIGAAW